MPIAIAPKPILSGSLKGVSVPKLFFLLVCLFQTNFALANIQGVWRADQPYSVASGEEKFYQLEFSSGVMKVYPVVLTTRGMQPIPEKEFFLTGFADLEAQIAVRISVFSDQKLFAYQIDGDQLQIEQLGTFTRVNTSGAVGARRANTEWALLNNYQITMGTSLIMMGGFAYTLAPIANFSAPSIQYWLFQIVGILGGVATSGLGNFAYEKFSKNSLTSFSALKWGAGLGTAAGLCASLLSRGAAGLALFPWP
mgnify:CR=1 FL=1